MINNSEFASNDKINQLEEALDNVEITYSRWLDGRENSKTGKTPDKLDNYFRLSNTNNGVKFYVKDGLPGEIKNACMSAFRNIFGNN